MQLHETDPSAPHWWDAKWFLILIAVLMSVPFWWPTIPPLTDLFGHIGRYSIQLNLATSPSLQQWYGFDWALVGNLGVDLLVMVIAPVIGLEPAVKLIIMAIPVISTIGVFWISREVHGRVSPVAFMALPFIYGHPFMFGFVNFALAMGLTLNAFALWLRLGRLGKRRLRFWLFLPIGLIVWVTHSFAWGVLGILCFSAETVRNHDAKMNWIKAAFHAGLHCLSMIPPALLMVYLRISSGAGAGDAGQWFRWDSKLAWFMMVVRDRWQNFDLLTLAFVLCAFYVFARSKAFQFSRNLGVTALILAVLYVLLPHVVMGSAYTDMRLMPYIFLIALLAVRPTPGAGMKTLTVAAIVSLAFFLVRLGGNTYSFFLYHQRHTATLEALDHIPQGANMVSFMGRRTGVPWYTNREEHIAAIAIARKQAFSNDQWVLEGAQLVSIKRKDARGWDRDPSQMTKANKSKYEVWRTTEDAVRDFPRDVFDYLWLISPMPMDKSAFAGMDLVWAKGDVSVYRIRHDAPKAAEPAKR